MHSKCVFFPGCKLFATSKQDLKRCFWVVPCFNQFWICRIMILARCMIVMQSIQPTSQESTDITVRNQEKLVEMPLILLQIDEHRIANYIYSDLIENLGNMQSKDTIDITSMSLSVFRKTNQNSDTALSKVNKLFKKRRANNMLTSPHGKMNLFCFNLVQMYNLNVPANNNSELFSSWQHKLLFTCTSDLYMSFLCHEPDIRVPHSCIKLSANTTLSQHMLQMVTNTASFYRQKYLKWHQWQTGENKNETFNFSCCFFFCFSPSHHLT